MRSVGSIGETALPRFDLRVSCKVADLSVQTTQLLTGHFRLFAVRDRRITRQQLKQARHSILSFVRQGKKIRNDAHIEFNAHGINGAPVEGLERPALEVAPNSLRLVQLPGLKLAHVERGE